MIDKVKLIRTLRDQAGYTGNDEDRRCNLTLLDAKRLAEAIMLKEDDWRVMTIETVRPRVTRDDLNRYAEAHALVMKADGLLARVERRYNDAKHAADAAANNIL